MLVGARTAAWGGGGGDVYLPYLHIADGQLTRVCNFTVSPATTDRYEASFRVTSISANSYDFYVGGWNISINKGLFHRRKANNSYMQYGWYFYNTIQYDMRECTLPMSSFNTFALGREVVDGTPYLVNKVNDYYYTRELWEQHHPTFTYTFPLNIHELCSESPYSYGALDFEYLKYWTNGETLAHHLLPVVRASDGVVCLHDEITGDYYENMGTGGDFTYP